MRAALGEKLEVLDCLNKAGEEVVSDEDESDVDDEEGEDDEEEGSGEGGEEGEDELDEDENNEAATKSQGDASADTVTAGSKKAKTTEVAPDVPA